MEYGHVNLLKEVHIGHLRTFILGESVAKMWEWLGSEVYRANYQGDIGLHVAKALWGVQKLGLPSADLTPNEKAEFLGKAYAEGNRAYDSDPNVQQEINSINVKIYNNDTKIKKLYKLTRDWSIEYLTPIYQTLGTNYQRCYFESEVAAEGKKIVLENKGKVFEESDGAIIFPGEKYGLHNRVFITQAGNPTYEGKEMGLAKEEYQDFNYDLAVHVVANEQSGYFEVVFKAIEMIFPHLKGKKHHLSYGFVDLKEGKMSSRTGEIVSFNDLFRVVLERVREVMKEAKEGVDQQVAEVIALGAIKFSYLKYSPQPNMTFDLEKSVSLDGDSGPYLQYSYVRTQAILSKAGSKGIKETEVLNLEPEERKLLVILEYFDTVLESAAREFRPNLVCEYLINLASAFNLFYQKHRVLDSDKQSFRLELTQKVGLALKTGLSILGIDVPEKM